MLHRVRHCLSPSGSTHNYLCALMSLVLEWYFPPTFWAAWTGIFLRTINQTVHQKLSTPIYKNIPPKGNTLSTKAKAIPVTGRGGPNTCETSRQPAQRWR
jgi:hypothetical protein